MRYMGLIMFACVLCKFLRTFERTSSVPTLLNTLAEKSCNPWKLLSINVGLNVRFPLCLCTMPLMACRASGSCTSCSVNDH
jgi:hypothetical protein